MIVVVAVVVLVVFLTSPDAECLSFLGDAVPLAGIAPVAVQLANLTDLSLVGFGTANLAIADDSSEWVVRRVTTLRAWGPGSLGDALSEPAERAGTPILVVFEVSGTIDVAASEDDWEDDYPAGWGAGYLVANQPNVYVAGSTAPAPGITVWRGGIRILAGGIVVQHIAVRPGGDESAFGGDFDDRDAFQILGEDDGTTGSGPVDSVVLDHVSATWATDELISTFYPKVSNITISSSIIAEALNDAGHPKGTHSKALLIGDHSTRVAIVRNVFAHNADRNPFVKGGTSSVVAGNLIYDWGFFPIAVGGNCGVSFAATVVGNRFKAGPGSAPHDANNRHQREATVTILDGDGDAALYLDDNLPLDDANEELEALPVAWVGRESAADKEAALVATADDAVSFSPGFAELSTALPVVTQLACVGSRPGDRAAADARILDQVRRGTGSIIDSVTDDGSTEASETQSRTFEELLASLGLSDISLGRPGESLTNAQVTEIVLRANTAVGTC